MHLEFRVLGIAIHKASAKGGSCGDSFIRGMMLGMKFTAHTKIQNAGTIETRGRFW